MARVPGARSLRARSWLAVGEPVDPSDAREGDVVILSRGRNPHAGHVGFLAGPITDKIPLLGGNQGNKVSVAQYPAARLLGIRRLSS